MSRVVTVPELLDGHTVLDVECLDRIYLNGYVPMLQVAVSTPTGPTVLRRIPAIVATLATDGWDRIGFNARQCGLGR